MKMKAMKLFALMILTLVLFTGSVSAVDVGGFTNFEDDFVFIDKVEVNGQVANELSPIHLEREQDVVVAVFFSGNPYGKCASGNNNRCYDTRVSAEINGYEYGDIRDTEGLFEVEPGVQYRKLLKFKLPEDMPASDDLSLVVEIKDDDNLVMIRYPLRIQEIRHRLNVFDVIFNPTNNVQAGQPLFVNVRLENLGDNTEPSIKATIAIPALGIQTSEYVDRLSTLESDDADDDENVNDAATTNDLMLLIPQNTQEGDYNVVVSLEYNRGRSIEQKTYKMHVKGTQVTQTQSNKPAAAVNVDMQAQRVDEGTGAVFKFSVANLGQQASVYTFEVTGVSDWANTKVEPGALTVQPNAVGDAYVYVAPKSGTMGIKTFNVKVMSGTVLVAEKSLSLETVKNNKADLKTVFTWAFIALLAILALLVVVVLVKKLANREEKSSEGQTYY